MGIPPLHIANDVAHIFSSREPARIRGLVFVASIFAYIASLILIAPSVGDTAEVLVLLPVVTGSFLWSWKGGLTTSAILIPVNIVLIETLANDASSAGFSELPRHLLIVVAGVGAGIIAGLTEQVSRIAGERREAQRSLEKEHRLRGHLAEISRSLSETRSLDELVSSLNLSLKGVAEFDHLLMGIRKNAGGDLKISHSMGKFIADIPMTTRLPRLNNDTSIVTGHLSDLKLPNDDGIAAAFNRVGLHSWIMTPLYSRDRLVGLLIFACEQPDAYAAHTGEVFDGIGAQVAPVVDNAVTVEKERSLFGHMETQNWDLLQAKAELQVIANELTAKNEALETASETRTAFLSMISHELRTPLTIMNGFAEYLTMNSDKNLTESQLQYVGVMQKNGIQLSRLVDDLLDVARLESGRFELDFNEDDAVTHMQDVVRGFKTIASEKQQILNLNAPQDEAWAMADRGRLTQVVSNLLSNASKYSAEETDIDFSIQIDATQVVCDVKDQGIGMSKEALSNIFHTFYRAPELKSQNVPGTGLGLVIARSIINQHGGDISVESTPGGGSTFKFWLPLSTADSWTNTHPEPATHEAA